MSLLRLSEISLSVGPLPLFDRINLVLQPGQRVALVGRNGTGKSTFFKLLAGEIKADSGVIEKNDAVKVAMLQQEVPDSLSGKVSDVVASGLGEVGALIAEYERLSLQYAEDHDDATLEALTNCQGRLEAKDGWQLQQKVHEVIAKLDLDGEILFESLSGGMKRRALLAKALVVEPDLLLLDEPTNHLDIESITWLENFLKNHPASLLFVSHDRAFLQSLATRVIELDRGKLSDWTGDYENYLLRKEEALHAEKLEQARFDKKLSQEETWIRQGIKARRTRNEGRVRALKAMRQEKAKQRKQEGQVKATIQMGEKSGNKVISAKNIHFSYDEMPLIDSFSINIMRGDKVGIIGPNGVGKSTLIKVLLQELQPAQGTVKHGTELTIKYFDQHRAILDENLSVRDNVAGGSDKVTINGKDKHVMSYLQDFLFAPDRANSPIKLLSGGERNRLLLAKLFATPANVLVLDEPTNDLDIDTLELLEEIIADFKGTVILISHDRAFLNNIVTSTVAFEGDGKWQEYVGGYEDWLRQKPEDSAVVVEQKFKKETKKQPAAKSQKRSYKDQRELDMLPDKIAKLESDIDEVQTELAKPDTYQDHDKASKLGKKLSALELELETAYTRWGELDS